MVLEFHHWLTRYLDRLFSEESLSQLHNGLGKIERISSRYSEE
jgi:hypothetical protein